MKRLILAANILIVASMVLSACAAPTPETIVEEVEVPVEVVVKETVVIEGTPEVVERVVTATPGPVEEADTSKYGGTLTIQAAGMVQFDFAQCSDDNSWWVISNVYSMLYRINRVRSI